MHNRFRSPTTTIFVGGGEVACAISRPSVALPSIPRSVPCRSKGQGTPQSCSTWHGGRTGGFWFRYYVLYKLSLASSFTDILGLLDGEGAGCA